MPLTTPSTAWSSAASANTMLGLLPPSSSVSFTPVPATAFAIALPTSVEPVKAILSTPFFAPASAVIAQPASGPPVTMFTTPSGSPHSCRISASMSAVSGVVSAGLSTQVLPQASAGASFHAAIISGKFHGMICPHTPTGRGCAPANAYDSLSHQPA